MMPPSHRIPQDGGACGLVYIDLSKPTTSAQSTGSGFAMSPSSDICKLNPGASWKLFKAGDQAAFERLYRDHFTDLFRYGMTLVPDEATVKDSIQQLFVDLWKYRANVSDAESPSFYRIRSLRNIPFKHLRESKRYACVPSAGMESYESLPSSEMQIIQSDEDEKQKKKLKLLIKRNL